MLSKLKCGCLRDQYIFGAKASKLPNNTRDPSSTIRQFLSLHPNTRPSGFERASNSTFDWLYSTFGKLQPYHFNDVIDNLRQNTSPGIYYRKLGFRTKAEVVEKRANALRYQVHRLKSTNYGLRPLSYVCVVDSTINPTTGVTKNRVAWVYPIIMVAVENMFFEGFRRRIRTLTDWVPSPANAHSTYCGSRSKSYDFTSFDSSVPNWLIHEAFDMIEALFDFGRYAPSPSGKVGIPYASTSLEGLFGRVRDYFINTPFTTPSGATYTKVHGVPSGSMFTNLVDTIVSRMVLTYLHGVCCSIKTYGDDCHVKCNCGVSNTVAIEACRLLGFKLKIEEPNEHGCLTYCKAECHQGQPFHPGPWFAGIFMCLPERIHHEVAYCLLCAVTPTRKQAVELLELVNEGGGDLHPVEDKKLAKLLTGGLETELASVKLPKMSISSL